MKLSDIFAVTALMTLIGAGLYVDLPDWDIGLSLFMGGLTIASAPVAVKWLREKSHYAFFGLCSSIFVTDYIYVWYNRFFNNPVLQEDNFAVSFPLYWMVGIAIYYLDQLDEWISNRLDNSDY